MKRIDFENGTITGNILGAALPMLVAQLLNLLYNVVDRIYIARIPGEGTAALGAVGLCFPLIVIITAFANLFGSGGAPLFSIYRGKKQENLYATEEKEIEEYRENYKENIILQELFIRQGIYFRPRFFEKGIIRENRPIVAVGFEETYFPSKFQIEKFQRFIQELKKTDVKWFFFTSESREEAFSIGKQTGIVEEKREVEIREEKRT